MCKRKQQRPFPSGFQFATWFAVAVLLAPAALASTKESDGVYGRWDGDLGVEPGLGAMYSGGTGLPKVDFAVSYLSTLGLRLHHADSKLSFGAQAHDRSDTGLDFELRPLFLARWTQGMETGPAVLDLTLDSFMLGLGVFWENDRSTTYLRRGAELITGFGVPLFASNNGPWLRATAALRLTEGSSFTTHAAYALVLGWNFSVNSHVHDDLD
jgi:hypothetical protein